MPFLFLFFPLLFISHSLHFPILLCHFECRQPFSRASIGTTGLSGTVKSAWSGCMPLPHVIQQSEDTTISRVAMSCHVNGCLARHSSSIDVELSRCFFRYRLL